jgi:hypothetical protein
MRESQTVVLTVEELQVIQEQARRQGEAEAGERFTLDEMQAIREQFERQIAEAAERREELEFGVRMALTRLRDGLNGKGNYGESLRQAEVTLKAAAADLRALIGEPEPAAASPTAAAPSRPLATPPAPSRPLATPPAPARPLATPPAPARPLPPPPPKRALPPTAFKKRAIA